MKPAFGKTLFASALASMAVPASAVPPLKVGVEQVVPSTTASLQAHPDVARDARGNYVVVWESSAQDGSGNGVFGRRFDANGQPTADEFRVNDTVTLQDQQNARVAMAADGRFVVVWESEISTGVSRDVFARVFTAAGAGKTTSFRVNQVTASDQFEPDVAADVDGNFVVAWTSLDQDGDSYGLYARRFDAQGAALGNEFQVSNVTAGSQSDASIAHAPDGSFVIAWSDSLADGSSLGIFGRRFSEGGVAQGLPFRVNTVTTGVQAVADVAMDASGAFVISFQDLSARDGDDGGIFARRYSAAGTAIGNDFQVNTFTTGSQNDAAVAMDAAGDFAIAWSGFGKPDPATPNTFVQRYRSDGSPMGGEIMANTQTTGSQVFASAAMDADGDLAVAWSGPVGGIDSAGVAVQRFRTGDGIDLDLTQSPDAATAFVGGATTFTVDISNLRPFEEPTGFPDIDAAIGAATGFSVTSTLPGGEGRLSAGGTHWLCQSPLGTTLRCDYSIPLAAGQRAEPLAFQVQAGASDLVHAAALAVSQRDPRESNNAETDRVTVTCAPSLLRFSSPTVIKTETGTATVQVERTGSCGVAKVQFDSVSREALAGLDFTDVAGVLTWADGDATPRSIEIPITADALDEPNEHFGVTLSNPQGATLDTPATATVQINDNDASPSVTFTRRTAVAGEGDVIVTLTAQLSVISGRSVRVPFTRSGTATSGTDYVLDETQIEIPAGSLSGSATIQIVDDAAHEPGETAAFAMGSPVNATQGVATSFVLTIADDD